MKTPAEIETELGLQAGTVRLGTDTEGRLEITSNGSPVVVECSLWALRCICTRRGFDPAIETGMAALGTNPQGVARARWNYAGDKITRYDRIVKQLRGWVGYNERQMDALFAAAVELEAAR